MRLFPSLRAQTAAIVVAGLIVSNVIGFALYSRDRQDSLLLQEAFDISERAAGVSRLLRDIPDGWNPGIVAASNSRAFHVWKSNEPPFRNVDPTSEEDQLSAYLRTQVPRIHGNEIHVWFRPRHPDGLEVPEGTDMDVSLAQGSGVERWSLVVAVNHGDDAWLNFIGQTTPSVSYLPTFLAFNLLTAAFGLGVVALWLVNRVTAPLHRLAHAAGRLGQNLNVEPLREIGPLEVRMAARAFNRMQTRLIRQIQGRTGMLAAISHDLRTPITQMRLRTELEPASENREKTLAALDEMNTIIGTFLDYARASNDTEQRSLIDLGSLIESICDDFSDSGADVACDVRGRILLTCRRIALKRAVSNIIQNALTYGDRADVTVSCVGHEIVISIEDAGPGIPEGEMEAVLQPFQRLESSRSQISEGVGLGLSIAQMVIEDHGGSIRLANRPTGGLRVDIGLPATGTAKTMTANAGRISPRSSTSSLQG